MKISGVIPVHNEAEYLRYSLPSLKTLGLDEYVFVIDRCTDQSEALIRKYHPPNTTIAYKNNQSWTTTRAGESFQAGYDVAKHEVVFAIGADLIMTPESVRIAKQHLADKGVGIVCYGCTHYPIHSILQRIHSEYLNFRLNYFINKIPQGNKPRTTGIYAYKKSITRLMDQPQDYIDLHKRIRQHGYNTVYIHDAGILHLRPTITKDKLEWAGQVRAMRNENIEKVFCQAMLNLEFRMFKAYLHARQRPLNWRNIRLIFYTLRKYEYAIAIGIQRVLRHDPQKKR